jgi:hypothetical protein
LVVNDTDTTNWSKSARELLAEAREKTGKDAGMEEKEERFDLMVGLFEVKQP